MTSRSAPRILLLQARHADDPMASQERACFVKQTGLPAEHIVPHDLKGGPPTPADLAAVDALMVGGSGDFYVSRRNLPQFDRLMDRLRDVADTGFPMFASCFGYQLLVVALGGEIVHDPENTEVGTYEITVTDAGLDDPLFGILPRKLMAQMGHKDRAKKHPPGFTNLVRSERSPNQAFRVPGQPIWATQFHPELERETNLERYMNYLEGYAMVLDGDALETADSRFHDSPEASGLIPRFLELVFEWPASTSTP